MQTSGKVGFLAVRWSGLSRCVANTVPRGKDISSGLREAVDSLEMVVKPAGSGGSCRALWGSMVTPRGHHGDPEVTMETSIFYDKDQSFLQQLQAPEVRLTTESCFCQEVTIF